MDFKDILNALIKNNLSSINNVVSKTIKDNGFDPAGGSSTYGPKSIGSIDLVIVSAEAEFSYNLGGLSGLSSSKFNQINISAVDVPIDAKTFNARGTFSLGTIEDLESHAKCEVEAEGCIKVPDPSFSNPFGTKEVCKSLSEGPSARITMHSYNVDGRVSVSGTIMNNKITIEDIMFEYTNIEPGHVNVSLSGMGPFNGMVSNAVSFIADRVISNLSDVASSFLPLVFQEVKQYILPISEDIEM